MVKKKFEKEVSKLLWNKFKFNSPGWALTITKEDNKIMIWDISLTKTEFVPESEVFFNLEPLNVRIMQEKDVNDSNSQFALYQQELGKEEMYKKIEPSIVTRKELMELLEERGAIEQKKIRNSKEDELKEQTSNKLIKQKRKLNRKNRRLLDLYKRTKFNPRFFEEHKQLLIRNEFHKELYK